MLFGKHLLNYFFNISILVDDVCFSEDSHVGFPIQLLLTPCFIVLEDLKFRIGDQPEWKLMFGNESLVRF